MTMPPSAAMTKARPALLAENDPVSALTAVPTVTRAVASLKSDSPSRMATRRRGNPMRRATAVAATASGGATTPPSAIAAANPTGMSHHETSPTANAVTRTSRIDSWTIWNTSRLRSMIEVRIAVAYSSGGRNPSRITSESTWTSGTCGRYDATAPMATSSSGADRPTRRARTETLIVVATSRKMGRAMCTSTLSRMTSGPPNASARHAGRQRVS